MSSRGILPPRPNTIHQVRSKVYQTKHHQLPQGPSLPSARQHGAGVLCEGVLGAEVLGSERLQHPETPSTRRKHTRTLPRGSRLLKHSLLKRRKRSGTLPLESFKFPMFGLPSSSLAGRTSTLCSRGCTSTPWRGRRATSRSAGAIAPSWGASCFRRCSRSLEQISVCTWCTCN